MNNDMMDALARDYKKVFRTESGQRVLKDLERMCGYNDSSVNEQDPNELQTMFKEGKRRVYLRVLWYLNREVKQ